MTESETSRSDTERPDSWERVSLDDLPEPNFDEYPLPDPDELTEEPVTLSDMEAETNRGEDL